MTRHTYDPERFFLVPKYVFDDPDIERVIIGIQELLTESSEDDDNTELVTLIAELRLEQQWRSEIRIPVSEVKRYKEYLLSRARRRRKH